MKIDVSLKEDPAVPKAALVLYGRKNHNLCFATTHEVVMENGLYELTEGMPLTAKALRAIGRSFDTIKAEPTVLHKDILYSDDDNLVFWTKAKTHRGFFKVEGAEGVECGLNESSRSLALPAMVWVIAGKAGQTPTVYVFACKSRTRPDDDTPLFLPPLMNVSADGEVCWGNAPLPSSPKRNNPEAWVDAFFASSFTHFGSDGSNIKDIESYEQYASFLMANQSRFPLKKLLPLNANVRSILRRILKD